MAYLHYREFRRLKLRRQEANSSVMALLAGSKLAISALRPAAGSQHTLAEIFPSIGHIQRIDLTVDAATELLEGAENHLATMALPYVLALHEDYVKHCCLVTCEAGQMSASTYKDVSPKSMHRVLAEALGCTFDIDALSNFEILRTIRNCLIHTGAVVNDELEAAMVTQTPAAQAEWARITHQVPPTWATGNPVTLRQVHVILGLSVTSALMKQTNAQLAASLPRLFWAERLLDDALGSGAIKAGNPHQQFKMLRRFANNHYQLLTFTDAELVAAASQRSLTLWPGKTK